MAITQASYEKISFSDAMTILCSTDILSISVEPAEPDYDELYLYRDLDTAVFDTVVWDDVYAETSIFHDFVMDLEISHKEFVDIDGLLTYWRRVYYYEQYGDFCLVGEIVQHDI